jgi:hypothetical protein
MRFRVAIMRDGQLLRIAPWSGSLTAAIQFALDQYFFNQSKDGNGTHVEVRDDSGIVHFRWPDPDQPFLHIVRRQDNGFGGRLRSLRAFLGVLILGELVGALFMAWAMPRFLPRRAPLPVTRATARPAIAAKPCPAASPPPPPPPSWRGQPMSQWRERYLAAHGHQPPAPLQGR